MNFARTGTRAILVRTLGAAATALVLQSCSVPLGGPSDEGAQSSTIQAGNVTAAATGGTSSVTESADDSPSSDPSDAETTLRKRKALLLEILED